MKRDLMDILCCPVHKTDLKLTVEHEEGQEVVSGDLHCEACDFRYPIEEGIPNLLPPEMHEKTAHKKPPKRGK
ncbi:MAG TPA: methytransferase partner Trm112 [Candidatus Thermoplasmatota archaeon]|nr:methytransferase partner Trm112 [Candidatus Thermoplasmatota archaeon]